MADYAYLVERLRYVYGRTRKGEDGIIYIAEPRYLNCDPELVKYELLEIHNEAPAAIAYRREFKAQDEGFEDEDDEDYDNQSYGQNGDQDDGNRFIGNQFYGSDSDDEDEEGSDSDDNAFFYPADCEYVPRVPTPPQEVQPAENGSVGVFKKGIDYDTDSDSDSDTTSVSSDTTGDSDCAVCSDHQDECTNVKGTPNSTATTDASIKPEVIHAPTVSTAAVAAAITIVVTPPSPTILTFDPTPPPKASRFIPFHVVAMPLSMDPAIKMIDSDLLNDIASANLRAPEITSIIVFSPNGTVITHASSTYHLRDLRRLAATCGQTFLTHHESASTDATPTTSHGSGEVANMFLEFDTNTALVSRISEDALLAIVGPRELAQDASFLTNGAHTHNDDHIDDSSTKSEGSTAEHDHHESDNDDASSGASKHSHQRRSSQDLAPSSSPLVLEALEQKSEALTQYLGEIMKTI